MADAREHLNVVFIGHVDAGKSTLSGQILLSTGQVDERTIEKYEKEAKEKNRESWWVAFIMDTNEEERAKGKTVEVGRAHFQTEKKRYTILDAPGHKSYVPNMIAGAAQADVGILVISARRGEFEAGFDRSGQTREHATLAKTLGVRKLIIAVNKMDEETVNWAEERFDAIKKKLVPYLKSVGYSPASVDIIPISAISGANLMTPVSSDICSWYKGDSLIGTLDAMKPLPRNVDGEVRIPLLDKWKDRGTTVLSGKIESGTVSVGDTLTLMPNKQPIEVTGIEIEDLEDVTIAQAGENVNLLVKGADVSDVSSGFVLCSTDNTCPVVTKFIAQLVLVSLPGVFTIGHTSMLHIHTQTVHVTAARLYSEIDRKTKKPAAKRPRFVQQGSICYVAFETDAPICLEKFSDHPQMGRFTLRHEGLTIGIGKVLTHQEDTNPPEIPGCKFAGKKE